MEVLRKVNEIELNKGEGQARGLFNVSNDTDVSLWFDTETKDRLMDLNDADFLDEANNLIY